MSGVSTYTARRNRGRSASGTRLSVTPPTSLTAQTPPPGGASLFLDVPLRSTEGPIPAGRENQEADSPRTTQRTRDRPFDADIDDHAGGGRGNELNGRIEPRLRRRPDPIAGRTENQQPRRGQHEGMHQID
jgi:hypothetical protein